MTDDGLALFIMVDALGARFLRDHRFLPEFEYRGSLRTVLGYSCSCEPTIMTGRLPQEHGHGAMYMLREGPSVLDAAKPYGWLPRIVADNHRVRARIHRSVDAQVEGYFSLYEAPTHLLPRFDLVEKRNIFRPGGIRRGDGIFDLLEAWGVRWSSYYWNKPEEENLRDTELDISQKRADWIFLYLPRLDGLLHAEGLAGQQVLDRLAWYDSRIRHLVELAHDRTDSFECYVFSDHGMSDVTGSISVIEPVERAFGPNGGRYLAFYDSTMARFWVEDPELRIEMESLLSGLSGGRLLPRDELRELGSDFPDRRQGDLVFLLEEGLLILPSYMGREMLAGMHGYHPNARWADACFVGLTPPTQDVLHLKDVYGVMAHAARRLSPQPAAD